MYMVASLIPKIWRLHNSLKDQVNNIGCISHAWFKLHSEVVVNWVHAIHKNWLFSNLQKVFLQKKTKQYQYHHDILISAHMHVGLCSGLQHLSSYCCY